MSNEPQKAADQEGKKPTPMYKVLDTNQRGAVGRKHDVITKFYKDGKDPETVTYDLFSDKATEMPMEHAMRFLIDPAFRVIAPNGNRIMPVPKRDATAPVTTLGEDQIVVSYNELSREALFRRVKVLPGSEDINERTSIADMAKFMVEWNRRMVGMTEGERNLAAMMVAGGLDGALTEAELEHMFPKSRVAAVN